MNKKQIVQLIKKMAIEDPPIPGAAPAATPRSASANEPPIPAPAAPRPAPTNEFVGPVAGGPAKAPVHSGDPAKTSVGMMQAELVSLAKNVVKELGTSSLQMAPGQTEATPEQKEVGGRTSFGDFVSQHYMRQSDVPGVEYSPDPKRTQMREKDPTQATRMNVVMDTMQRLGGPQSEFKIDGVWGPRTNASLHNAYAYAYALLKLAKDFNYPPTKFDEGRLQQLQQLIEHVPVGEENKVSSVEKQQLASEIVPYIRGIWHLFEETKQHILQKPAYRSYIEGSQPYVTYKGSPHSDPQAVADLSRKFTNMRITQPASPGVSQSVRAITVSDLVSPQALQDWQKKNNMTGMAPSSILQQVRKHLDDTDVSRGQS